MDIASKRARIWKSIAAFSCVMLLMVAICGLDWMTGYCLCAPPSDASTFAEVASMLEQDEQVWLVDVGGDKKVVVFGQRNPFSEYRSGYLFDMNGNLVHWTDDANQSNESRFFWSVARLGNNVTYGTEKVGTRRRLGVVAEIKFPISQDVAATPAQ